MDTSHQQTYFPDLPCFGCGPANALGLQLQSFVDGDRVTASFTPRPEHDNGLGFLNGGIIATVLDCHSAAAVTHAAHERGWPADPGVPLPYVTAGLDVRYRRPTPLRATLTLVAEVREASRDEITAHVRIEHDGKVRAEADALWKRWRAR
ncbi:acyl-coenzyme A thioesterase PaaI-like protein [Nocardioides zeae]|uniref:Acyl-coenzyme A thioesterase PaaI-like protein n=1 Tax=Nocardioides zeae TaxID=1457234 RepID=A0ACC6ID81_9ACTN|nr:PaaI family thioesterase [Nocardioides zeae]MDR6175783.1 acyl-coenzyme A thioesterase PaaI-like protein [Nocardioides zeae]MDR6208711.1 acyl-coenzyme A thioesterase PaaI-like protein [Nocardioides zeae]